MKSNDFYSSHSLPLSPYPHRPVCSQRRAPTEGQEATRSAGGRAGGTGYPPTRPSRPSGDEEPQGSLLWASGAVPHGGWPVVTHLGQARALLSRARTLRRVELHQLDSSQTGMSVRCTAFKTFKACLL